MACGTAPAENEVLERFVKAYDKASPAGKRRLIVLVPQQMNLETERRLIEMTGGKGLFGAEVLSFSRMTYRLLSEHGAERLPVLDAHGRVMLVQKAVSDVGGDLSVYQNSCRRAGFATEAARQIADFRENDLTPEQISGALTDSAGSLLEKKLGDLGTIYQRYLELLGEDRTDEEGRKRQAARLAGKSEFFRDAQIFVVGFSTLSAADTEILMALAKRAESVTIGMVTDPDPYALDASVFESVNRYNEQLAGRAFREGVPVSVRELPLPEPDSVTAKVEQGLFAYRQDPQGRAGDAVSVISCEDPWDESRRITQEAAKLIRNGMKAGEIAVLMPDSDLYGPLLARSFDEYGIPYFLDRKQPVIQSGFVESVLSAVDAVRTGWRQEEILSYAKSSFSGLSGEESDILENFVVETGVSRSDWKTDFTSERLKKRIAEDAESITSRAERIRVKLMKPFDALETAGMSCRLRSAQLRDFLERNGSRDRLDQILEGLEQREDYEGAALYRQNWNILLEVLQQIDDSLGDEVTTLQEYADILKNGLATYSIGIIPETSDAVLLTDLTRGKIPSVRVLMTPGMNEGILPSSKQPAGLLSEQELESLSGDLAVLASARPEQEEYQFYSAIARAEEKLLFTEAKAGTNGTEQRPSVYLDRLFAMFELEPPEAVDDSALCLPGAVLPELSVYYADLRKGRPRRPWLDAAAAWLQEHPDTEDGRRFKSVEMGKNFVRTDDSTSGQTVRALYGDDMRVSVSRLEEFAQCPFKHYMDRGLRLTEREPYEVRPADSGTLIHSFFESFLRELGCEKDRERTLSELADPKNPKLSEWIDRIFDREAIKKYEPRFFSTKSSEYAYSKLRRMLTAAARVQVRQLQISGYEPKLFEVRLNEPIGGETEAADTVLQGRIDRIDLRRDGNVAEAAVVDYKSGRTVTAGYSEVAAGLALQLLIYLSAACDLLEQNLDQEEREKIHEIEPAGAFYSYADPGRLSDGEEYKSLRDVRLKGFGETGAAASLKDQVLELGYDKQLDKDQIRTLLSFVRGKAAELTLQMRNGETSIAPSQQSDVPEACRFCSYRSICSFDTSCGEFTPRKIEKYDKKSFFEKFGASDKESLPENPAGDNGEAEREEQRGDGK